jgi:D-cysteine desulfhydrase family pyridoxal phosphate-dependent enzyme
MLVDAPEEYRPPAWASQLRLIPGSRVRLARTPTPIERFEPPGFPDGVELWIKRDDLTGIELSGNKIRKLEFLLADALARGCDTIITCGGIQSNHCRAAAIAARRLGLSSQLLLRTERPDDDPGLVGNLLLERLAGARVLLVSHSQYQRRALLMEQLAEQLRDQGHTPYVIPEGGSNGVGSWGYLEAVCEIAGQLTELDLELDHIVIACGSGGTAAGLGLGARLAGLGARIHPFSVCDDAAYFHQQIDNILAELGASDRAAELVDVVDGYKGLGYSISRPEELAFIREVARETGVFLDPAYTGKALYGLGEELRSGTGRFTGKRVLFVHTGGLFGLYEKAEQISALLPAVGPFPEH